MNVHTNNDDKALFDHSFERLGVNHCADDVVEACANLIVVLHQYPKRQVHDGAITQAIGRLQAELARLSRWAGEDPVQHAARLHLADIRQNLRDLETAIKEHAA